MTEVSTPRFEPLRPAPRGTRIAAFVIGPLVWLFVLIVVAALLKRTSAIELGLLVAFASFVVSFIGLLLMRVARRRQELRYADSG